MPSKKATVALACVGLFIAAAASGAVIGSALMDRTPRGVTAEDSAATAPAPIPPFDVTGYADPLTTFSQLGSSLPALTTVSIDAVDLTPDGAALTPMSTHSMLLQKQAYAAGTRTELLFSNFDSTTASFSRDTAALLFASDENIAAVARSLVAEVHLNDWSGITVDLESLRAEDADGLTRFVTELRSQLGSEASITMPLMASNSDYASLGYDLPALIDLVDRVVLMAYDQHGPRWSDAGPVGGYPWMEAALGALLQQVPGNKVQLGIGMYGYTWPVDGGGTLYSVQTAREVTGGDGAEAIWDPVEREWHTTLANGTQVWWSDERSYAARRHLAERLELGGVAIWSLGLSAPLE
ncbi:MAG: hydrolase [Glaciihabitans sp.]|nr:hydrolase [Glaciihabitans sp.]